MVLIGQSADMRLIRNPDIHGNQIIFQYAADLWTMDRGDGFARRLTTHPGQEGAARFSPDGKWIAFTASYDGNPDVYVMPSEGGEPKRLTFSGDPEVVLDWTPDGKIGFKTTSQAGYFVMPGLWTVDPKGGIPTPTPVKEIGDGSFSPSGDMVAYNRNTSHLFNWRRYRGGTQGRIGFFDLKKKSYSEIPSGRENRWQPQWIGDKVYYISDKDFGTRNLFEWDVDAKRERRVTDFRDADIRNPGGDTKSIVFERNGSLEVFDIASGKVAKISARAVSDFPNSRPRLRNLSGAISNFALSPSGVRVAAEARGEIFSVPVNNGETRNLTNTPGVRERAPSWSPDGQTIAYLSDADGERGVYTMGQRGGDVKKLKLKAVHDVLGMEWMPDSKGLVLQTRAGALVHYDVSSSTETVIAQNEWQATPIFDISHDGTWIAYTTTGDNLQSSLNLFHVPTKKSTKVTDGYFNDNSVSFDLTGKYLYFVSGRTFIPSLGAFEISLNFQPGDRVYMLPLTTDLTNPLVNTDNDDEPLPKPEEKPAAAAEPPPASAATPPAATATPPAKDEPKGMKIDLEGLADRAIPLPWPPGSYPFIMGTQNGVATLVGGSIQWFSLAARQSIPLYQGPLAGFAVNAKRNKVVLNTGAGLAIMDLRPGSQPRPISTANVEVMWDPKAEYRQILREAWLHQKHVFYDPNMLGLNWDAVWKQYEAQLPYIHHRADLNYLIGQMIGELGTGHAYVQGGEMGDMGRPVPVGALGADYEVVGNRVRFARVFRGLNFDEAARSPLGAPGVNVKAGDYLLEIDGKAVTGDIDPHMHLVNKVGKNVVLTVNSTPTLTGARKVTVQPIFNESELRYMTWVEENRAKVAKATNGKVGYLHVPDTSFEGMIGFIRGYYSQMDKEAWIIDERFNGGGFIPTFFIEFLQRQVVAKMKNRDFKDIAFPVGALEGPKVMLVNEYAGSGGDMLPWLFKNQGLGKLIGKRTWGGLVGIQGGVQLIDGGNVTSPGFGIYDPVKGQWIAENTGVDPDIDVDARPDLIAQGQDPQLDRAIEEIKKEMARNRGRDFKEPAFPRVNK